MVNVTLSLREKILSVCILSVLLLSPMQLEPVYGASAATSKEAVGTQLVYGQYQGEQGDWLYIQADQMEWNGQSQSVRSGTGNPIWKVDRSLTKAEAVTEEAFTPISEKLQTWDSGLSQWQEVSFVVEKGIIKVGSLKLFAIPDWGEDSSERTTRVGVMKYPGQTGETIYRINYMTSPPGAASVHDFSTYLLAIEKKGKVQVVQAPKEGRILRSRIIMPWGKGQYLLFGDMPGPDFSAAARVTSDGKYTDLNDYIGQKMKIKDWPYAQILGIRNEQILFSIAPPLKAENWSDLRETGIYELDMNLTIKAAPETLKTLRVIDSSFNPLLGSDGTLYHIGGNGEILFDLTHRRQLDLFQGKSTIGSYSSVGTRVVKLTRSGKDVTVHLYRYKGIPCLCAEDMEGMNFARKWDSGKREARLTVASGWKPVKPTVLKGGSVYRSDTIVLFNGVPVPSYNTGGWSLVPMRALEAAGVIKSQY